MASKPKDTTTVAPPVNTTIAAPMEVETWPIGRLLPYVKNAKKHSDEDIDKMAASLKEFGWRRAFVAEENGIIVIGHRMRLAALKLGIKEVPVNVARGLSAEQIKALRLIDNRLNDNAVYDPALLGAEFLDLNSTGFDLSLTGFEMPEIAGVMTELFGGTKSRAKKKLPGEKMAADGVVYRVLIDATNEQHQAELLKRFKSEGLKAAPLIS